MGGYSRPPGRGQRQLHRDAPVGRRWLGARGSTGTERAAAAQRLACMRNTASRELPAVLAHGAAEMVNGMVTHPLAREPAHYGPVRSMAAAVSGPLLAAPSSCAPEGSAWPHAHAPPFAAGARTAARRPPSLLLPWTPQFASPCVAAPLPAGGPGVDVRRLLCLCLLQGVDAGGRPAGQPVDAEHGWVPARWLSCARDVLSSWLFLGVLACFGAIHLCRHAACAPAAPWLPAHSHRRCISVALTRPPPASPPWQALQTTWCLSRSWWGYSRTCGWSTPLAARQASRAAR